MSYSLNPQLFVENGPAVQAAKVAAARPSTRFRAWRKLDSERRFSAVETALKKPANDLAGGYPLAL
jgi:hypothetical protein